MVGVRHILTVSDAIGDGWHFRGSMVSLTLCVCLFSGMLPVTLGFKLLDFCLPFLTI